ncbi:hypothetical protein ACIGG9_15980 [Pseudonocardia alni]|uniref:hypothetical protein n=1 Tax=Pseudonocardia alni TaxID=33907 RepID=UPI00340DDC82
MAASYSISLVARVPAFSGPPALTELGGLVFESVTYIDELNKAGSATVTCPIRSLHDTAKARFRDLVANPCELWIYRNSKLVWAGGVETIGLQQQNVVLGAVGLYGYVSRMGIMADYSPIGIDQFLIPKTMVDNWQARGRGHYGIDTSAVGTSGVVRTQTYLQKDLSGVASKVEELSKMTNGFDIWVEPDTRRLRMASPQRGQDLSAKVFLDQRNIESASIAMSVAPGDLVTDASATGTSQSTTGESKAFWSSDINSAARLTFGASWAGQSFQDTPDQTSVNGKLTEFLKARSTQLFQPGVSITPRAGADVGDFAAGDSIFYGYDAGLGYQSGVFRTGKLTVTADKNGDEQLGVEFV